jgi:hypothetical protein
MFEKYHQRWAGLKPPGEHKPVDVEAEVLRNAPSVANEHPMRFVSPRVSLDSRCDEATIDERARSHVGDHGLDGPDVVFNGSCGARRGHG